MGGVKKYFILSLCVVALAGCAGKGYVKKDKPQGEQKRAEASSGNELAFSSRYSSWEKVPVFETIYFEYDKADPTPESLSALRKDFELMKDKSDARFLIEGHCDERGNAGYNFSLGRKRADAVRQYLVKLGVPSSSIAVISYGSDKPSVRGSSEEALARNRRAEIKMRTKSQNRS